MLKESARREAAGQTFRASTNDFNDRFPVYMQRAIGEHTAWFAGVDSCWHSELLCWADELIAPQRSDNDRALLLACGSTYSQADPGVAHLLFNFLLGDGAPV
jgi:hypothetical protein